MRRCEESQPRPHAQTANSRTDCKTATQKPLRLLVQVNGLIFYVCCATLTKEYAVKKKKNHYKLTHDCFLCLFREEEHKNRDCVFTCVINHQKPTSTQLLPGATRTHPHVAKGNKVPTVFRFKAKQMPTVSDRFQGADF